jgi:polyadenylation factor subunit 2
MATLLQGVQEKSIPPTALPEMIDARAKGETLANIYRKYVVEPQQEAPGGMPGMPPGLPPGAQSPPGGPPGAPGLPQGVVPPAPPADALMSRLGVPAGNRQSFMSVGA